MSTLLACCLAIAAPPATGQPELPGRPAPQLARLFTPRTAPAGSYGVTVLDVPIDRAVSLVRDHFAPQPPPQPLKGAWAIVSTPPLTAFGETAIYEQWRVAQLYVAKLAKVVRAPIEREGHVVGSVMLISPYPDPTLSRLEPGTLLIYFDAVAARRGLRR